MMMSTRLAVAGAALLMSLGASLPVRAQETGIAAIHAWVKVGRKTCMATHTHDGSGSGKTKKEAERTAVQAWESFTAWEYGSPWARYANSESKKASCDRAMTGEFKCSVNSRPCVIPSGRSAKRKK